MRFLLAFFIAIPILEMAILIKVGSLIGVLPTIGLVMLTAVIGLWLLRLEGLATWIRVQEKLTLGEVPGIELLEGIMLIIGGALLLTPGFFTDTIGFICLIPGLRKPLARRLVESTVLSPFLFKPSHGSSRFHFRRNGFDSSQYEGEYTVVDEEAEIKQINKEPGKKDR